MKSRSHQQGIALVITLIMLSVTLVMAVAFLAISTRERGSVSTVTDGTHALQAAQSALAQAEGQIVANILTTNYASTFDLLVSTNYILPTGFVKGVADPTNVNYYYTNGGALSPADWLQNIANLEYLPRAPVFVPTNNGAGYDFRFYLDLNRNGQFEDTGVETNWQYINGNVISNGLVQEIGDPQWIGVLEHPDQPHGPLNPFIARYAFIAVPVGNTLDVNAMYNDSTRPDFNASSPNALNMKPGEDGFLRNEGVGSWELNLAAFLADLNTNEWDPAVGGGQYQYETPFGLGISGQANFPNRGVAFDDALSILRYRYSYNLNTQTNIGQYFNREALVNNGIDTFSVGILMTNNFLPFAYDTEATFTNAPWVPWSGSGNTNLFYSPADFFNENIFRPPGYGILSTTRVFPDRLMQAGTNTYNSASGQVPTYDRYTFYRMLAQLGTDSTPDYGRMNLNYVNVDTNGNVIPGMETNYVHWLPLQFFTNAANRMLLAYSSNWISANFVFYTNTFRLPNTNAFGVGNIPVWINGVFTYTPAVHRILQLAANLYDASTNSVYPSVFRPSFYRDPVTGNVYINGYTNVDNIDPTTINTDVNNPLNTPVDISAVVAGTVPQPLNKINIYGVPWVVGAKKNLPSFNEFYELNTVQVTRKLQVIKPPISQIGGIATNQLYLVGITNTVGMSFWNSYYSNFFGVYSNFTVYMSDIMRVGLTNPVVTTNELIMYTNVYNLSYFPGSGWNPNTVPLSAALPNPSSFVSCTFTNCFIPVSAYQWKTGGFLAVSNNPPPPWETNVVQNYLFPQTGLQVTNWSQAYILDGPSGGLQHIVDYVQFAGPSTNRNINLELNDPNYPQAGLNGQPTYALQWSTNSFVKGGILPSYGEVNQILVSRGFGNATVPPGGQWTQLTTPSGGNSIAEQQAFFNGFWNANGAYSYLGVTYTNTDLICQAPYTPTRTTYDFTLWQANDPLVHYLASDLTYIAPGQTGPQRSDIVPAVLNVPNNALNLNQLGSRYQPWGLANQMMGLSQLEGVDTNAYNMAYKDPFMWRSDYWDFPTNLYPNVGWIGRVHRGTPWQTVYMKATDLISLVTTNGNVLGRYGTNTWQSWSGNNGNFFDAVNASPVQDRLLFDLFTTEPNENATLGELSVNQPNMAAWSAVFSGLPIYTNVAGPSTISQPAGAIGANYVPGNGTNYLGYIWSSIQQTRTNNPVLFPSKAFLHTGDILATPALTEQSPFLPWNSLQQLTSHNLINDQMAEWLPQETMSLLKVGSPRYVIYCYGQALRPAPNGKVTSGTYALMNTNYQIVAESALRAVVQVENASGSSPKIILKNLNPLPPDQ